MYVAMRQLKISVPGEGGTAKVVSVPPGKPVPGAEAWSYPCLMAQLNLGLIEWKGDQEQAPHLAHRQRGVVIPMIFRQMAPRPSYDGAREQKSSSATTENPTPEAAAGTNTTPPVSASGPVSNSCASCAREFKTSAALKSHIRSRHPEDSEPPKAS